MACFEYSPHNAESTVSSDRDSCRLPFSQAIEKLLPVMEELSSARDLEAVMAITRQAVRDLTGADGVSFILREDSHCRYADEAAIQPLWKGKRFPMHRCLSGWVIQNRQPAVIEDIATDERIPQDLYLPTFVRSLIMVPIRKESPVGAIGVYWARKCSPSPEEVKLLQSVADLASSAMRNVQLYAEMQEKEEELRKTGEIAEAARKRAERRAVELDATINAIADGVVILDPNGEVSRISPMAEFILRCAGKSRGRAMRDLLEGLELRSLDGSPVEMADTPFMKALQGETVVSQVLWVRAKADKRKARCVSISAGPIRAASGRHLLGAIANLSDITQQIELTEELQEAQEELTAQNEELLANNKALRESEKALAESEERFRTLADNMSQFAWMADERGWIFWYNKRWFDYTGTTLEEMRGWGWKKVHHPDHVDRVVRSIQHSWDTGEPWEDVFPLRGKDGRYRWFLSRALPIRDKAGRILRWFGTNTDITEQRQAEEALRNAHHELDRRVRERTRELLEANAELRLDEARFEALFQMSQMRDASARAIADFVLSRLVELTKSTIAWIGFLNEDESTTTIHAWHQGAMSACRIADKPMHFRVEGAGIWARAIRERRVVVINDYAASTDRKGGCPEGHVKLDRLLCVPIFDRKRIVALAVVGNKEEDYVASDVRQVTLLMDGMWKQIQRRKADEERKLHIARLERLNKELEDFAFIASHHLQEPLRKIHTFGDKLRLRCTGSSDLEANDCVKRMQKSASRMRSLLYDLMRYSRITLERGEPKPVDLTVSVAQAIAGLDEMVQGAGATIEYENLPTIEADHRQILELFKELITNAIKFQGETPPVIKIRGEVGEDRGGRPFCTVTIEDNGIGFEERHLERVFAPFQQLHVHERYEGTGMGLAICRRIVERHNGSLTARSSPGVGTTFIVTLPLHQERQGIFDKETVA